MNDNERTATWREGIKITDLTITARIKKCFLWGKGENDKWAKCHWFKNKGDSD